MLLEKSFHMSFAAAQRQAHNAFGNNKGRPRTKPLTDDQLADTVIKTMDRAEAEGIDLARAILRKLDARRPKRTARN